MGSRKMIILFLILLLLLPLTACSRDTGNNGNGDPDPYPPGNNGGPDPKPPSGNDGNGGPDPKPPSGNGGNAEPNPEPPEQTTIAGIALGDPAFKVAQLFGEQYLEDTMDADDSYYEEDVSNRNYQDRIFFSIGQSSQTVLRIYVADSEYETNLGVKVGQRADTFMPLYQGYYEELVSFHSDDVLYGWFQVENGGLLIFYFTDDGEAIEGGTPIPDEAIVENIALAYLKHFD